jgi:restriction system protein
VTFLNAAEKILRQARKPLTAREITELALAKGLIQTAGKTPEATMSARLYVAADKGSIRRDFEQGGQGRARRGSVRWRYVGKST